MPLSFVQQVLVDLSNQLGWGINAGNVGNYQNSVAILSGIPAMENSTTSAVHMAWNPFNVSNQGNLPAGTLEGGSLGDILQFPTEQAGAAYTASFLDNFGNTAHNRYAPILQALQSNSPITPQLASSLNNVARAGWSDTNIGGKMTQYSQQLYQGAPIVNTPGSYGGKLPPQPSTGAVTTSYTAQTPATQPQGNSTTPTGSFFGITPDAGIRIGLVVLGGLLLLAGLSLLALQETGKVAKTAGQIVNAVPGGSAVKGALA